MLEVVASGNTPQASRNPFSSHSSALDPSASVHLYDSYVTVDTFIVQVQMALKSLNLNADCIKYIFR